MDYCYRSFCNNDFPRKTLTTTDCKRGFSSVLALICEVHNVDFKKYTNNNNIPLLKIVHSFTLDLILFLKQNRINTQRYEYTVKQNNNSFFVILKKPKEIKYANEGKGISEVSCKTQLIPDTDDSRYNVIQLCVGFISNLDLFQVV